jgi:hypothetical protein
MYPEGDRSARPSAKMPQGGYYFDSIIRQPPIDDAKLDPADNLEEFQPVSDEDLRHYERQADDLYRNTDLAIAAGFPGTAFGDIALVPGPWMKDPKGIRDIEEWYVSTLIRQDYIREVFARQAEIAVENLKRIHQAVGDKVHVVFMDGTDLASQNSLFCSPETYRELYLPHAKKVNDWVHAHTGWKTLKHCCGGCEPLIDGFIAAGYDVLNPVQTSARGMDPRHLVETYGDRIVFWGGGVDTQQTLPFGTPDEVKAQVADRVKILSVKTRLRLQHHPQHPVQHPHGEPPGHVRGPGEKRESVKAYMREEGVLWIPAFGRPAYTLLRIDASTRRLPPHFFPCHLSLISAILPSGSRPGSTADGSARARDRLDAWGDVAMNALDAGVGEPNCGM